MRKIFAVFGLFFILIGEALGQDVEILSSDRLFNLGNEAYENDKFDDAIYYYEKARLLDPMGLDITTNLQLANERLSTDIIELEPFFLASWWNKFNGLFLPGGWKILSVVCLIALLFLTYFYFFRNKPKKKNLFYLLTGILIILFLLSVLAGKARVHQIYNSPFAIVTGGDQSLYLGPDVVSEQVKEITGGNKLRILDGIEDWYKVSAMDSEQGWIKKENVRLIKF